MKGLNFVPSSTTPCLYYSPSRNLRVIIHVDDFLCSGREGQLKWLKVELQRRFTLKVAMLGERSSEKREVKFLNRLIWWTSRGLEIEGDPRHAKTLLE